MPEEPIYGPFEDLDPRPLIKRESAKNTARIGIRLSKEELKGIDNHAKLHGITRSELLRGVVAGITIKTANLSADEKSRTMAICGAANNLNQIARHANRRPNSALSAQVLAELEAIRIHLENLRSDM